jgi:hypothetical protein
MITVVKAKALKQEKAEKRVKEDMLKAMIKERKAFNSLKNQAYKEGWNGGRGIRRISKL